MRDFRPVFYIIGILLCIESITMLIPMVVDLIYKNSDWQIFLFLNDKYKTNPMKKVKILENIKICQSLF